MDNPQDEETKICPYCAETIKRAAIVCRYCGRELAPLPQVAPHITPQAFSLKPDKPKKGFNFLGCLFGSVVAIVIFAGIGIAINTATNNSERNTSSSASPTARSIQPSTPTPTPTIAQIKESALAITYDSLARETEAHVGKIVYFRGDVLQVMESAWNDETDLRVSVVDGDAIYVNYSGPRVLVGDTIDLYAKVDGRLSYETVLGAQMTIPELTALVLAVVEE